MKSGCSRRHSHNLTMCSTLYKIKWCINSWGKYVGLIWRTTSQVLCFKAKTPPQMSSDSFFNDIRVRTKMNKIKKKLLCNLFLKSFTKDFYCGGVETYGVHFSFCLFIIHLADFWEIYISKLKNLIIIYFFNTKHTTFWNKTGKLLFFFLNYVLASLFLVS